MPYFNLGPNIHWTSNYGTGIVFIRSIETPQNTLKTHQTTLNPSKPLLYDRVGSDGDGLGVEVARGGFGLTV